MCAQESERLEFLTALSELGSRQPVTVVLAVRDDFLARCLYYPALERAVNRRGYNLAPMREADLARAVTGPAEAAGARLETGLVELILSELRGSAARQQDQLGADPGALPLLSHVMATTWEHRVRGRLTIEAYHRAGGVAGSVERTAELAWAELSPAQRGAAQSILLGLVQVDSEGRDSRRRRTRSEFITGGSDSEVVASALEVLVRSRLVTSDGERLYFTHEVVLQVWPRLRRWIDANRAGRLVLQQLDADAAAWQAAGRESSLLYRGTRLATAQQLAAASATGIADEFLSAAELSGRRSRRRNAVLLGVSALALVGVLILTIYGNAQAKIQERDRQSATLAAISAEADSVRGTDPSLSAMLDLVAYQQKPEDRETWTRLLDTQNLALATTVAGHHDAVTQVAYQPGGTILATASADRTVRLWPGTARSGTEPTAAMTFDGPVRAVAFDPGGTLLAATDGRTVRIWQVGDPARPGQLAERGFDDAEQVTALAFAPDGRRLMTTHGDRTLRVWSAPDLAPAVQLPLASAARSIVTSPRVTWFAVAGDDAVQLWDARFPGAPAPLGAPLPAPSIRALAVSPDGAALAVGSGADWLLSAGTANADFTLWDTIDSLHPRVRGSATVSRNSNLQSVTFGSDADTLAVGDRFGVTIWNTTDRDHPTQVGDRMPAPAAACPPGDIYGLRCQSSPNALSFAPDGHTVAAGGTDGRLQLWSLPPAIIDGQAGWGIAGAQPSGHGTALTAPLGRPVELWDIHDRLDVHRLAQLGAGPVPGAGGRPASVPTAGSSQRRPSTPRRIRIGQTCRSPMSPTRPIRSWSTTFRISSVDISLATDCS